MFTCGNPDNPIIFWTLLSLRKLAKYNRIIHSLLILSFFAYQKQYSMHTNPSTIPTNTQKIVNL